MDLLLASWSGDVGRVRALLEDETDVNEVNAEGRSVLLYACGLGHAECARILLKAGADVNHAAEEGEWDGPHRVYAPPARGWRRRESCQLDWQ
mmetsp:Transcript_14653/g.37045  ORF Transcript_14653/g.37045 Transcript_14653/m.37045 type:complete len:93 (-) Transcript_14653:313-591(-)